MRTNKNTLIYHINKETLSNLYDIDIRYFNDFEKYLHQWTMDYGSSLQDLKDLKTKFIKIDNLKQSVNNVLYMLTWNESIIYVGQTEKTYFERLLGGYSCKTLIGHFIRKHINEIDIYVYKTTDKEDLEAKFIKYFTNKNNVLLNMKCEKLKKVILK